MSNKKDSKNNIRHTEKRRKALKTLTAVSGVAAIGAGAKWGKPMLETIVTPAHAQTSVVTPPPAPGVISAAWFLGDDAPGGYDAGGVTGTQTVTDSFLYDDGTDMRITATVTPAQAIPITVSINGGTTTFGTASVPTTMTSADTGVADFGTFDPSNGDFGDAPGTGAITVTLSSPGFADHVITLNVS
ncbi:MAG: hypothetical protein ACRBHB_08440 [Arenicella sp.]